LVPVIALVANELGASEIPLRGIPHVAVSDRYVRALHRAGARALVFPAIAGAPMVPPAEMLEPADGLLLIGGGDIDPARYGQRQHTLSYGFNAVRDEIEIALAAHALATGVPMLAICRGCQIVNVAAGGTLHQHIPDLDGMDADCHGRPHDLILAEHPVSIRRGSALEAAVGTRRLDHCISAHHQAVDVVGEGLHVTARSDDGCVEALEPIEPRSLALCVQWHPEMTAESDARQQALFDTLVEAATRSGTGAGSGSDVSSRAAGAGF
jgi:putative glutamine amidotransferase